MRAQYVQFAKNEGKFILQQNTKKKEQKYEIDREMLVSALWYQDFFKQFIEVQEKWAQLIDLVNHIITVLPDTTISEAANDESKHETLLELQLRRDKELADKDEERKYQGVKQIILPIIQSYIQRITKDTKISSENKQEILNLTKKI